MKKFVLLAVAALLISVPVFAASSSSSTQLIAVVGNTVTVTGALPASKTIDLTNPSTEIGSITITSNITGNWTIKVTSANNGNMKGDNPTSLTPNYPYTITLAPSVGAAIFANQSIGAAGLTTTLAPGLGSFTYTLTALYATPSSLGLAADTYRDTVTITVTAL